MTKQGGRGGPNGGKREGQNREVGEQNRTKRLCQKTTNFILLYENNEKFLGEIFKSKKKCWLLGFFYVSEMYKTREKFLGGRYVNVDA